MAKCGTAACHVQLLRTVASLMPMSKTYFVIYHPSRRTSVARSSIFWTVHQKHRRHHPHLQPKTGPSLRFNFAFELVVILSTMLRRSQPRRPPRKLLMLTSLLRDFHSCLAARQKARARSHLSPDVHRLMILSPHLKPLMQPMVILLIFGSVLY